MENVIEEVGLAKTLVYQRIIGTGWSNSLVKQLFS